MRTMIPSVLIPVLWLGLTPVVAQLPPEILMDRYLVRAERRLQSNDPMGSMEALDQIAALCRKGKLSLPEEFSFQYARATLAAGALQTAIDSVKVYLAESGSEGAYYREALALWEDAEEKLLAADGASVDPGLPSDGPRCKGQPKGTACWLELANQRGCYVWENYFIPDQTVMWTAECAAGLTQGTGTLKLFMNGGKKTQDFTGLLVKGKMQGPWVLRGWDGSVKEGPYVKGKPHGRWILRWADGRVWEGPAVEGKTHGHWVERDENGTVAEGQYVQGKKHGHWVQRDKRGIVAEGRYVAAEKHGHWVERDENGTVAEGQYVQGKKHGHWVQRDKRGIVAEGRYVAGKKHGDWVERDKVGIVAKGRYVAGEKHGHWVERDENMTVAEGRYVAGRSTAIGFGGRMGVWLLKCTL